MDNRRCSFQIHLNDILGALAVIVLVDEKENGRNSMECRRLISDDSVLERAVRDVLKTKIWTLCGNTVECLIR